MGHPVPFSGDRGIAALLREAHELHREHGLMGQCLGEVDSSRPNIRVPVNRIPIIPASRPAIVIGAIISARTPLTMKCCLSAANEGGRE